MLSVDPLQALFQYMGIDLGGGEIGVTEHHLHRPQVGSPLQEMGRKGMAQGMGLERRPDPRQFPVSPDHLPEPLAGHPPPSVGDKDQGRTLSLEQTLAGMLHVLLQCLPG